MSRKAKHRRANKYDNNLIKLDKYIQKQINLIPRNINQEHYIVRLLNPKKIITILNPSWYGIWVE